MSKADDMLAAAKEKVAKEQAEQEAIRRRKEEAARQRQGLIADATSKLAAVRRLLFSRLEGVPQSNNRSETHSAGVAILKFRNARAGPGAVGKWDVIAWAPIEVVCARKGGDRAYTWSASLIYMDRGDGAGARWCELGFFTPTSTSNRDVPFAVDPNEKHFRYAVEGIDSVGVAYGPLDISGEGEAAFMERWTERFALAMDGTLERPRSLPLEQ